MVKGRIPGSGRGAPQSLPEALVRPLLMDPCQSAEDSSSASGCENSGFDSSTFPVPYDGHPAETRVSPSSLSGDESPDPALPLAGQENEGENIQKRRQPLAHGDKKSPSTATPHRAASKAVVKTTCLAPRRLRLKAPPRVAWVSGKFIRELGTDEHRGAQLPKCASFVYSVCHVEGYDIRAVHQDAMQKHVRCRLMNDERSALMLEVDECLHLADPKARSQEAFQATCGIHHVVNGGSQVDAAEGVRSFASAVAATHDDDDSAWATRPFPSGSHHPADAAGSILPHEDFSSEVEAAAIGGARSLRMSMRPHASGRYRSGNSGVTVAFIFESGPVVLWIAASDARARDSRGRRELLSSLLFFLSQFATRFVRADMVQEDIMRFAYIRQVRTTCPAYQVPKSRIQQDCIYLKTESIAEKLAVSFALAQSIRLSVYESLINFTIARVRAIPERMARFGLADEVPSPPPSSSIWGVVRCHLRGAPSHSFAASSLVQPLAWSRLCGDLLGKIVDVNIVQDFRDVPEYFWNDDTWQHFWRRLYDHLEIQKRINLLNSRYFCIHELLKVIREERRSRQEFRLTWIVVILLFFQSGVDERRKLWKIEASPHTKSLELNAGIERDFSIESIQIKTVKRSKWNTGGNDEPLANDVDDHVTTVTSIGTQPRLLMVSEKSFEPPRALLLVLLGELVARRRPTRRFLSKSLEAAYHKSPTAYNRRLKVASPTNRASVLILKVDNCCPTASACRLLLVKHTGMEREAFEPLGYATTQPFLSGSQVASLKTRQNGSLDPPKYPTEPGLHADAYSGETAAPLAASDDSISSLHRSICVSLLVNGRPQAFIDFFSLPLEELEAIRVEGEGKCSTCSTTLRRISDACAASEAAAAAGEFEKALTLRQETANFLAANGAQRSSTYLQHVCLNIATETPPSPAVAILLRDIGK
ncbi:hypothetical protein Esti_004660 [Eimeria stiedai]